MDKDVAVGRFAALADPVRLSTVEALARGPLSAGDLARHASVSPPLMSRHLRILLEAGLVSDSRDPHDARRRVFTLRHEGLVAARAWVDQVQAQWSEQLAAFQAHVETTAGGLVSGPGDGSSASRQQPPRGRVRR